MLALLCKEAAMDKPNILVICSDEHHPDLSGYRGNPYIRTPNLDELARRGTVFPNAVCTCPVCTPSRMSFITGKYVHQIDNWMIGIPLSRAETTWARRLDRAGIPSTMLGKMDFCGEYQDGGFTDYKIIEVRDAWNEYPRKKPFVARLHGYRRADKRRHLVCAGIRQDQDTDGSDGHNERKGFYDHDRFVTQWALDYIDEKAKNAGDNPWALYLGYLMPHWPYIVPKEFFEMYYPDKVKMPFDAIYNDNPGLHPALAHFQRAIDLGEVTEDMVRRTLSAYYGMVTSMDNMIGQVIDALKAKGMYDNTYIIYTSDHGDSLGEHGLFYKQVPYRGSVGVPLIVSGPGLPEGKIDTRLTSLIDLYPTVLDMAGLEPEPDRPGKSWLQMVKGELPATTDDFSFSEFHGNMITTDWYMLMKGDYKYIYYVDERPSLFNVKEDPRELNDLACDPQYALMLREFEVLLRTVCDPEAVALRAKRDLGLLGPDGEDYAKTRKYDMNQRRVVPR